MLKVHFVAKIIPKLKNIIKIQIDKYIQYQIENVILIRKSSYLKSIKKNIFIVQKHWIQELSTVHVLC